MTTEIQSTLERFIRDREAADFLRLVDAQERDPGSVDRALRELFERPDGPVTEVSEETECERVEKTAKRRWDVEAADIERPSSFDDIVALLESARDQQRGLRFVGSARSLSRAPQPPAAEVGNMVATCEYDAVLEIDSLRDDVDAANLYRAEGGRVFADIILDLDAQNMALADMGSGDFQSFAGALSTSTHGSGVAYPAIPGMVRSMDVACFDVDGRVVKRRIEPSDGITDPAKFAALHQDDGLILTQDDDLFNAWVVSLGCLGSIYSVTVDTVPCYWLQESRTTQCWSEVKAQMDSDLNGVDYYEVLVDSWPTTNETGEQDYTCLVTRRNLVTDPELQHVSGGRPITMALAQTELGRIGAGISLAFTIRDPLERVPWMLNTGVTATQVESYTDKWFEVLLLRLDLNANSSEIGVPLVRTAPDHVDPGNAIQATERLLALAAENQATMQARLGDVEHPYRDAFLKLCRAWRDAPLHTSPLSLRFVREDTGSLSMQYGAPTCMIETPMPGVDLFDALLGTSSGAGAGLQANAEEASAPAEALAKALMLYESYLEGSYNLFQTLQDTLMSELGVRPHWGQTNFMTWAKSEEVYAQAGSWREVYERANHGGVFDNPLTDQLGISKRSS